MNNQFHIACIFIYQLKKIEQHEKQTKNIKTTQKHRSCFQREKLGFSARTRAHTHTHTHKKRKEKKKLSSLYDTTVKSPLVNSCSISLQ